MARNPNATIVNVRETPKTRWRAVPYTGGRGIDVGCGAEKLFDTEFVIGLDNCADGAIGAQINPNLQADGRELAMFASGHFDYLFSSYVLQCIPYAEVSNALRNWMRVVKTNASVVLYLPDEKQYPRVGEPGAHPMQKWDVNYDKVVDAMARTAWNWDLTHYEVCDKNDEYSLFFAFKRLK
jgi:predicted SAM-dependent methyltransferase